MPYDASNTKHIRAAVKRAAAESAADTRVVFSIMSSSEGRAYIYKRLERAFIFHTPFTGDDARTNFNLGVQSAGLQELAELMRICPDLYIMMIREVSDKEIANGRRSNDDRRGGDLADGNGGDSVDAGDTRRRHLRVQPRRRAQHY